MAQRRISFTTFFDFVTARGLSRIARVKIAISMYTSDEYRLADYYLDIRHAIIRCFNGGGMGALDTCLATLSDPRKRPHYTALVAGLRRWIGRKTFEAFFEVPTREWSSSGLCVSVRPELGLKLKGERLIIKLYFKDEALDQHRINPLLHLLHTTHGSLGTVAILDVRRGKLFKMTRRLNNVDAFLAAEAQYFMTLWDSLAA